MLEVITSWSGADGKVSIANNPKTGEATVSRGVAGFTIHDPPIPFDIPGTGRCKGDRGDKICAVSEAPNVCDRVIDFARPVTLAELEEVCNIMKAAPKAG